MKLAEYIGSFLGSRLILVTFPLLLLDTPMKSTHKRKFILPPVTGYHSKSITEGRLGKELKHLILIAVKNIKKMNTYTLPAYCLCLVTSPRPIYFNCNPRNAPPTEDWAFTHKLTIKTIPHNHVHVSTWPKQFLSWDSRDCRLWQVDIWNYDKFDKA